MRGFSSPSPSPFLYLPPLSPSLSLSPSPSLSPSSITGSANQLGELFDHGCDSISLYLLLLSGVSAVGLHDYPLSLLMFVVLLGNINFVYHWQTYVCGTLHFNL